MLDKQYIINLTELFNKAEKNPDQYYDAFCFMLSLNIKEILEIAYAYLDLQE